MARDQRQWDLDMTSITRALARWRYFHDGSHRWRSIEAIEGFAGRDIATAVVEPGAVEALLDFDAHARHYEVIEEAESVGSAHDG